MKKNLRSFRAFGFYAITLAPWVFTGCQSSETVSESSHPQSEYTAEVLKLKAGASTDYDLELSKLNQKFSIPTATTHDGNPSQQPSGVAKTEAKTLVDREYLKVTNITKLVFKANLGDRIDVTANIANIGAVNPADPMIFLIQIDNWVFKSTGLYSAFLQQGFHIVASNDDSGPGYLGSYLTHTFTNASEVGYYMWMILPYSNGAATGKVNVEFNKYSTTCPSCQVTDYIFHNPVTIGGAVIRGYAGNDFNAILSAPIGDPHLYVFKSVGGGTGMDNGNWDGTTKNAIVYSPPFAISAAEKGYPYYFSFIDNDIAGTTMPVTFSLYQN